MAVRGTKERERFGTGECERFRRNREETLGIAPPPQKSERQVEYKKNSGANNKVYDLKQRTVAALDHLAEVYETFEDTWGIVVQESAAGDMFFAAEEDAADKLDAAERQQDGALEALEECRKNMDSAYREFSNYRALHEAWFDVKETGRRHSELKKKE